MLGGKRRAGERGQGGVCGAVPGARCGSTAGWGGLQLLRPLPPRPPCVLSSHLQTADTPGWVHTAASQQEGYESDDVIALDDERGSGASAAAAGGAPRRGRRGGGGGGARGPGASGGGRLRAARQQAQAGGSRSTVRGADAGAG